MLNHMNSTIHQFVYILTTLSRNSFSLHKYWCLSHNVPVFYGSCETSRFSPIHCHKSFLNICLRCINRCLHKEIVCHISKCSILHKITHQALFSGNKCIWISVIKCKTLFKIIPVSALICCNSLRIICIWKRIIELFMYKSTIFQQT